MSNSESASVGQAQPTAVFAPSPRPRLSAFSALMVLVTGAFILGGFYLMSIAFTYHEIGLWLFVGGLLADVIGFWIAFGLLSSSER